MIPRRTFVVFDLLAFTAAYLLSCLLAPSLGVLFAAGGPFSGMFPEILAVPTDSVGTLSPFSSMVWAAPIIASVSILLLDATGSYQDRLIDQGRAQIVFRSVVASFGGLAVMALVIFALKTPDWSRFFTFTLAAVTTASLAGYRLVLREYLLRRQAAGYHRKNVVLVGTAAGIDWMAHHFRDQPQLRGEFALYGYFLADDHAPSALDIPNLGRVEELGDFLITRPIHEVVLIHPMRGETWLTQAVEQCDYLGVALCVVPEAFLGSEPQTLRMLYPSEPLHLPAVMLMPRHQNSDALFVKRLFDIVVSAVLLLLLTPVFLAVALAIKLSTPRLTVFYPWRVVGQNGVPFTGYKFTTMWPDDRPEEVIKAELADKNEMTGPVFKMKDDPRVTPVGKILRKYDLNELPQLWSVLKGHMSLVGPRPTFPHELVKYDFWHKRKLSVRPGITCLWQVSGRNKISSFDDWVKLDIEYIDNWSLWLDIKILARTARVVFSGSGS